MAGVTGRCESCGREDEPILEVRRVYLTPATVDRAEAAQVMNDAEHWCEVCREHYPHLLP